MSKDELIIKDGSNSELFYDAIMIFLDEISGLSQTLPLQIAILNFQLSNKFKELEDISDGKTEKKSEDGHVYYNYKIKKGEQNKIRKLDRKIKQIRKAIKIIPRNHIVSLVSQYDAYLGKIIRALFISNPNLLKSSEKEIKPIDLFKVENIDELKTEIIDKEVESILRESHIEQLEILERKISSVTSNNFTLTTNLPVLKHFVEITERRNLYVHTNGHVSRQYLLMKNKWGFDNNSEIALGTEFNASGQYNKHAFKVLVEIGIKLGHVLWRKFLPEDRHFADANLNSICYDLIIEKEYELAQILSKFGTETIRNHSSEEIRKHMIVNKALAFKLNGQEEECKDIIKSEDWSIGLQFKLVKNVFLDDFKEAVKIMHEIGSNNKLVEIDDYKEWPLFYKFRDSPLFLEAFNSIFGEEFTIIESQEKELVNNLEKRVSTESSEEE